MHGSLKDSYLLRTNFRDVAPQILHINHWQVVAESIRRHISDLNEYESRDSEDLDALEDSEDVNDLVTSNDAVSPHVKLGSRQAVQTFELIKNTHKEDDTFKKFRIKLNEFLTNFLQAIQVPLPGGKQVQLRASDMITECRFLKVNYESMVSWRQQTDYLRCNPKFFNNSCFDCVLIQTTDKVIFGRLLFLFECVDKHLNLYRVRARPCAHTEFFSVRSIIRGALLVPDGSTDYLVVNTIDTDMFLWVRALHLEAGHPIRV
ncbi:hypothetical protein DEU56DRAFT_728523 [Suillus clintonianus]|uniref:uncharacterized protein n=1 Tax=Suillus clintonianus TaxID=1904413 RepID=UPI001B86EA12|nr:uncharacterized protein DEU56DRAFT_728523 [Suillus clintonianus]KAG2150880.1 hypothetical protein DEU56DRAFT_728523 [Suillus clintonianus]